MQEPTQEEKNQAMENMECWKTQEHLKECRKCAPVGNWKYIEEEFRNNINGKLITKLPDCDIDEILASFKPYFQELLHKEAKEELETVDNH